MISITLDDPTEDGYVSNTIRNKGSGTIQFGYDSYLSTIVRGYIEWNISSLPQNATITKASLKYSSNSSNPGANINEMGVRPSTTATISLIFDEAGEGSVYANEASFPVLETNQEIELNSQARADIKTAIINGWFAIGIQHDSEATLLSGIRAEESGSANPKPTLYIEYDLPNFNPAKLNLNPLKGLSGLSND